MSGGRPGPASRQLKLLDGPVCVTPGSRLASFGRGNSTANTANGTSDSDRPPGGSSRQMSPPRRTPMAGLELKSGTAPIPSSPNRGPAPRQLSPPITSPSSAPLPLPFDMSIFNSPGIQSLISDPKIHQIVATSRGSPNFNPQINGSNSDTQVANPQELTKRMVTLINEQNNISKDIPNLKLLIKKQEDSIKKHEESIKQQLELINKAWIYHQTFSATLSAKEDKIKTLEDLKIDIFKQICNDFNVRPPEKVIPKPPPTTQPVASTSSAPPPMPPINNVMMSANDMARIPSPCPSSESDSSTGGQTNGPTPSGTSAVNGQQTPKVSQTLIEKAEAAKRKRASNADSNLTVGPTSGVKSSQPVGYSKRRKATSLGVNLGGGDGAGDEESRTTIVKSEPMDADDETQIPQTCGTLNLEPLLAPSSSSATNADVNKTPIVVPQLPELPSASALIGELENDDHEQQMEVGADGQLLSSQQVSSLLQNLTSQEPSTPPNETHGVDTEPSGPSVPASASAENVPLVPGDVPIAFVSLPPTDSSPSGPSIVSSSSVPEDPKISKPGPKSKTKYPPAKISKNVADPLPFVPKPEDVPPVVGDVPIASGSTAPQSSAEPTESSPSSSQETEVSKPGPKSKTKYPPAKISKNVSDPEPFIVKPEPVNIYPGEDVKPNDLVAAAAPVVADVQRSFSPTAPPDDEPAAPSPGDDGDETPSQEDDVFQEEETNEMDAIMRELQPPNCDTPHHDRDQRPMPSGPSTSTRRLPSEEMLRKLENLDRLERQLNELSQEIKEHEEWCEEL